MIAPFSSYSPLCTSKFSIKFLVQFSYSLEFLQTGKNWCTCKSKQEIGICLIPGLITICSDKGNYWGIFIEKCKWISMSFMIIFQRWHEIINK